MSQQNGSSKPRVNRLPLGDFTARAEAPGYTFVLRASITKAYYDASKPADRMEPAIVDFLTHGLTATGAALQALVEAIARGDKEGAKRVQEHFYKATMLLTASAGKVTENVRAGLPAFPAVQIADATEIPPEPEAKPKGKRGRKPPPPPRLITDV